MAGWAVVLAALVYVCGLFALAHWGDLAGRRLMRRGGVRATTYVFSLAVYCTSWTFFGSVGLASRSGLDFLAIYVGPILVIGVGHRFVARVVRIAKAQNATSVADFVAARYGKSEPVAALVCVIAVLGAVPYIALQLKAVAASLDVFLRALEGPGAPAHGFPGDLGLFAALTLAGFAVAFGTRHADATEHQNGLTLAIALESVVKLAAFLVVGGFALVLIVREGPPFDLEDLWPRTVGLAAETPGAGGFLVQVLLSAFAALLLPRQFHVTVVENRSVADVGRAAWVFPLYLVLINLLVIPLALAGRATFPPGTVDRDMLVLALPLEAGADGVALVAFLGGLSAATAMVIVETVAVAIMISNHLVMPVVLRRRAGFTGARGAAGGSGIAGDAPGGDLGGFVLGVRRAAIVAVTLLGYVYSRAAGEAALASIGLLSFAAIAQIGPAFLGSLLWTRGTGRGAAAGLVVGLVVWAYALLLPSLSADGGIATGLIAAGPFGVGWLRPTALFGLEGWSTLSHGAFWSLGLNALAYVGISLGGALRASPARPADRGEGAAPLAPSFRLFRASVTVDDLRATVARYLGEERTRRSFEGFARARGLRGVDGAAEADVHLLRYAEHLLASAIGAASARLALSLVIRRRNLSTKAALKLLDDASAAILYSRDLLQHALDHARQGITVFDRDLRLLAWNRAFADLYDLPPELIHVGIGLDEIVRFNARRGAYGGGAEDILVAERIEALTHESDPQRLRLQVIGRVIEIRANPLPHGGLVATYTDVTETVAEEEARERLNERLETRVRERTEELTRLNEALTRAKAEADEANLSKTRFLAAASHDILQPLNAARLYATALVEQSRGSAAGGAAGDAVGAAGAAGEAAPDDRVGLAENIDASLDAVEEILTALLDISRLDTGAMRPQWSSFRLDELFRQLAREFGPLARERGIALVLVPCTLTLRSDRRLLRRLLQNLISNAIKYTPTGRVLVGARRVRREGGAGPGGASPGGRAVRIEVLDTGLGIPASKRKVVFREFQRLDQGARVARGLGLGLSIVERVARVLDHPLALRSEPGRGSVFAVTVPVAAPRLATAARAPAPSPAAPLAGLRVLAIDNEPAILDGMRALLGGWGCRVETASSIGGALDLARRPPPAAPPAVILADYHLDDGDGLAAVAALRGALGAEVPAVLLTADRSPGVREAAAGLGVHVLNKPVKPASLRALLAGWRATRVAAE